MAGVLLLTLTHLLYDLEHVSVSLITQNTPFVHHTLLFEFIENTCENTYEKILFTM